MGKSYNQCPKCEVSFDTDNPYIEYCETCESQFCSARCAKPKLEYSEEHDGEICVSCVICRGEFCSDEMLMKFLLTKLNLTKAQAKKEYLKGVKFK